MNLLGNWEDRLKADVEAVRVPLARPLVPLRASAGVRLLETVDDGRRFVRDLRAMPLSAVALSLHQTDPGAPCCDVRFQRPTALAVAAWAQSRAQGEQGTALCGVLRLRDDDSVGIVADLPRLRVPVVVHDAKPILLAFWALGLDPVLPQFFDTHLAAACLHLGSHHPRARRGPDESEHERIGAAVALAEDKAALISLEGQCDRYRLPAPFSAGPCPKALASRAEATLRLYAVQQPDLVRAGLLHHLHTIEFPFAVANARIEMRGVHVDRSRLAELRTGCRRAVEHHAEILASQGIHPPGSEEAFLRGVKHLGIESTEDRVLEPAESLHPAVRAFRLHRRYQQIAAWTWECDEQGRVHPEHRQLAAATGRNGCRGPNLAGIGRILRPVVTAPEGRALVELDYSQIEVGVAAAEHEDHALIDAYNEGDEGDVYAAAAEAFGNGRVRNEMKSFVLGLLYGAGPKTIAAQYGISEAEAGRRIARFLDRYPSLARGLEDHEAFGLARGEAMIVSGLRRCIIPGAPEAWTRNWMRNTPIQGGATVVFKKAVIDLDRVFARTNTWLVLPIHDAILIECDSGDVADVCERSRRVMEDAMRWYYPVLRPRVTVNRADKSCWNKDGHADSLRRFLDDPGFRLEACGA